jgi:hypothetical protein
VAKTSTYCVCTIVSDTWSFDLLFRELDVYTALVAGESPAPPLLLQYTDFARWEREQTGAEPGDAALAHWRSSWARATLFRWIGQQRTAERSRGDRGGALGAATRGRFASWRNARAPRFHGAGGALADAAAPLTARTICCSARPYRAASRRAESMIGFFIDTQALRANVAIRP